MTAPADAAASASPAPRWGRIAAAGLLAGFASGLFGVGGGVVIVPALGLLAGFPHKLATGTSLTAIVPISIAGAVGYATAGEVDPTAALLITVGALAGAVVGTRWLASVDGRALQYGFAVLMVLTAVRLVAEGDGVDGDGRGGLTIAMAVGLVLLGLTSGVLAGLLGVGGGIVIVPVLTLLFGLPLALAKGTSLLVIVPTAVVGTLRNRASGLTEVRAGVVVGTAGIVSAFLASRLSLTLDPRLSAGLFAALLVVVAARLVVTARATAPAPDPAADAFGGGD
ncbi:MAG: sulfite exporter TauE/SafE family protein [Acidimicrobiales bacterium]|nr:sulfite exporter TauE/SafE family protein [Acidimicrobiales bacterium]